MKLFDGRTEFYQYDLNQKLICDHNEVGDEVHFSNHFYAKAAICLTYELDGHVVVDVPNAYLTSSGDLTVHCVCIDDDGKRTKGCHTFKVVARKKPSDYVYTETEVKSYEALEKRIELLENGDFSGSGEGGTNGKDGADGVGIKSIERTSGDGSAGTTDTYTITMTDGSTSTFTVYNGKDGEDGVGGSGSGANGKDGITPHIGANGNWFLGDTDTGIKAKGEDGKDGVTPVKGVDYFDGITPHIGDNKNWFIGDTDTGVKAEGKDGQNGVGGSGGSGDVYSTEEIVVGTWLDGKPIYRSFFVLGTNYSVPKDTACKVTGVDAESVSQIIKGDLIVASTTDYDYGSSPVSIWKSNADTLSFSSTDKWEAKSNRTICLVVDYTKSTDIATLPSATALMNAYDEGVNEA